MDSEGDPGAFGPKLSNEKIHAEIRQVRRDVPQYLFRMWHPKSGGGSRLNTESHNTPHAFQNAPGPANISDVDAQQLIINIDGHLKGRHVQSYFSSWSASLALVLGLAANKTDSSVAILDVTKLSSTNNVYWCGSQHFNNIGIDTYPEEYHVFGVISAPAYQVLPYERFEGLMSAITMIISAPTGTHLTTGDIAFANDKMLDETIEIGKQLAEPLSPVMTVFLACLRGPINGERNIIDKLLRNFTFSPDLIDPLAAGVLDKKRRGQESVSPDDPDHTDGWEQMLNATAGLQTLMDRQHTDLRTDPHLEVDQNDWEAQAAETGDLGENDLSDVPQPAPEQQRRQPVRRSSRYPAEVYDAIDKITGRGQHTDTSDDR